MTPGSTFPLPLSEGDSQDRGHQTEQGPTGCLTLRPVPEVRSLDEVIALLCVVPTYLDPVPVTCLAKT